MEARAIRSTERMSDLEAMMWSLEQEPALSSAFASLSMLDGPPDMGRLRARLDRGTRLIPQLRRKVSPAFAGLAPPMWEEDRDFDIKRHVRKMSLGRPATDSRLHERVAKLTAEPFAEGHPLWDFVVITGLEGGRAAILWRMHHTLSDGVGGIRMSEQFLDLDRDEPDLPVPEIEDPGPEPSNADNFARTLRHGLDRTRAGFDSTRNAALDTARDPSRLVTAGTRAVKLTRSLLSQVTTPLRPRSPLWQNRSLGRGFETISIPFDAAKLAANKRGGRLNDLFVAGTASGVARYHADAGVTLTDARMAMPINTREDASAGGNSFAPLRVLLRLSTDVDEQFEIVREKLSGSKADPMIGVFSSLAGVANLLPRPLMVRVARAQAEALDFTTSNLRAAPFDLYVAGARMDANYPVGPLVGSAFNLTMMSYRGQLDMGLHVDTGAVADPPALRDAIEGAFADLR